MMKNRYLIFLIILFPFTSIYGQIIVGWKVYNEIIETENFFGDKNFGKFLINNPYNLGIKKTHNSNYKINGLFIAVKKNYIGDKFKKNVIKFYPVDEISENSFVLIDYHYSSNGYLKRPLQKLSINKSEIIDYAILRDTTLIDGGNIYKKLVNYNIYKTLPDIVYSTKYLKGDTQTTNSIQRVLDEYSNFHYYSNVDAGDISNDNYLASIKGYDEGSVIEIGFTNIPNRINEIFQNRINNIKSNNFYKIEINYRGNELIRKAHSLKYLEKVIKFPKSYKAHKINSNKIDSISNVLYECSFYISKNGVPISKIDKDIHLVYFKHQEQFYSVTEFFYNYWGAGMNSLEFPKILMIENKLNIIGKSFSVDEHNKCDSLIKNYSNQYAKDIDIFMRNNIDFNCKKIDYYSNDEYYNFQYEREGKSLIKPYYDKTTFIIKLRLNIDFKKSNIVYYLEQKIEYFPNVKYNSYSSKYKYYDEYFEKIEPEYKKYFSVFLKKVCKKLNGEYIDNKCLILGCN